jgi:hypothetical protein
MRSSASASATFAILVGGGALLAGVYDVVPSWLGLAGFVLLVLGGVVALARSRHELGDRGYLGGGGTFSGPEGGDAGSHHGHHHGHHDGGGFFDGGGSFGGGDGGGGGGGGGN